MDEYQKHYTTLKKPGTKENIQAKLIYDEKNQNGGFLEEFNWEKQTSPGGKNILL